MELPVSTYALLFPAVSLLFLSYTNRFLHLSSLIRKLHSDWESNHEGLILAQISNLRKRLILIRGMQLLGATCLLLSVLAMLLTIADQHQLALILFVIALCFMTTSLVGLITEVWISGGALRILLKSLEKKHEAELANIDSK